MEYFLDLLDEGSAAFLENVVLASIGPLTSATLRRAGLKVDVEAPVATLEGLVAALKEYFGAKNVEGESASD